MFRKPQIDDIFNTPSGPCKVIEKPLTSQRVDNAVYMSNGRVIFDFSEEEFTYLFRPENLKACSCNLGFRQQCNECYRGFIVEYT